ncbi:MAG: serine/threonine-protein kinase [Holophagaceae bacterium]|nr:serine/threonine-protein kinase [Holophagaceae bacterium]
MELTEFTNRYKYNPKKDKIGSGGFGDVFKAYDTFLNNYVALKISKVENENIRLKKEEEMASGLPDHPNIANYIDCHTFETITGEHDFGILQYYEHGNLNQLLNSQSISYETINTILRQVLTGLEFLHSQKIIHRDMKPQNILMAITPEGEYVPKITDFGISKKLDADKSQLFSHSLTGVGSLSYASPEQLKSTTIRRNTDLWSFGVIAYQAFTGQLPFTTGEMDSSSEAGREELFRQIKAGEIPETINKITEPWKSLILKCLVPDPAKRIQTAKECLEILDGSNTAPKRPAVEETQPASGNHYGKKIPPIPYEGETVKQPTPLNETQPQPPKATTCSICGREVPEGSSLCRQCSDQIDTPNVGKRNPEEAQKKTSWAIPAIVASVVAISVFFLARPKPQETNSRPVVPLIETLPATPNTEPSSPEVPVAEPPPTTPPPQETNVKPPTATTADEPRQETIAQKIINRRELRNLKFGKYEWRVLDVQGDRALIFAEDVVEIGHQIYYNDKENSWEACGLRRYLNSSFLQNFTNDEFHQIIEMEIKTNNNPLFNTSGGNDTRDRVFLLSIDEVAKYLGNTSSDRRSARHWWWLRSPGGPSRDSYGNAACVNYNGEVSFRGLMGIEDTGGVRPALWIKLK